MTHSIKFFAIAVMALALSSISFSSCSKGGGSDKLEGTTWSNTLTLDEFTISAGFKFTSKDAVTMFSSDGIDDTTENGTYVYNKPNITMTLNAPEGEEGTLVLVGTIDGDKLNLTYPEDPSSVQTFTKQ